MTFMIFLPEDLVHMQRRKPYPAIYYTSGMTDTWEKATKKMFYARSCKKRQVVLVLPDTSPRDVDKDCPEAGNGDWNFGYSAGLYCDATKHPWNKHFKMFSYVTKELPELVERYFHVDCERRSIMGHSMGGHGALICAAKLPHFYKSVTALAPVCRPAKKTEPVGPNTISGYFQDENDAKKYSTVEILYEKGRSLKLPPGYVDIGARDQFMDWL